LAADSSPGQSVARISRSGQPPFVAHLAGLGWLPLGHRVPSLPASAGGALGVGRLDRATAQSDGLVDPSPSSAQIRHCGGGFANLEPVPGSRHPAFLLAEIAEQVAAANTGCRHQTPRRAGCHRRLCPSERGGWREPEAGSRVRGSPDSSAAMAPVRLRAIPGAISPRSSRRPPSRSSRERLKPLPSGADPGEGSHVGGRH
jgi:hypothetical protein